MSGIKITSAIDSNNKLIDAGSFGSYPIAFPIKCPDTNCNALVAHVNGYKRESYGKPQIIPPFFRLEKGCNHHKHCQYRTHGREQITLNDSECDVTNALSQGEFLFRVHVLDSDEQNALIVKTAQFQSNPPSNTSERKYRVKGKKSTYVRTMDSLLEIYQFGVKHANHRSKIKLLIGGKLVSWVDFFYSTYHLGSLRSRLLVEKIAQVAIIVKINVVRTPIQMLGGFQFIECYPKSRGRGTPLYATIKLTKNMTSATLKPHSIIMVLGKFSIPSSSERVVSMHLGNEIRTIINNDKQVVEI